jgi:NAD(P)-dependent dehydrogenase (short-subunit alcohol dehydrogenase family)
LTETLSLDGLSVVVTGAGRGIGRATALGAARSGAKVALVARSADQLERTLEEIALFGGTSIALPCDICDSSAMSDVFDEVERRFGGLDGLVNAAGVSPTYARAESLAEVDWDQIVETNLIAPLELCRIAGERMRCGKGGAIVNLSSVGAIVALPRLAAYCASKGGLVGATRTLAAAWSGAGVRVNCVAPAFVHTALSQGVLDHPEFGLEMIAKTPMDRFGDVDEVAYAALFFLSPAASGFTGQTLCVDGGWTAL